MENKKELFDLNLPVFARQHLLDSAKWARFLAIAGFILTILLIMWSVYIISLPESNYSKNDIDNDAYLVGTVIGGLVMGLISFFPCLFLLRFANRVKEAIATDNTELLTEALRNLKITFRYVGILTILTLVFFLLGLIGMLGEETSSL